MRIALVVAAAVPLAACSSNMNYVIQNYDGVVVEEHVVPPADGPRYVPSDNGPVDMARKFRIFDKPLENRMMITASLGDAAAYGFVRGLVKIDVNPPTSVYRDAAIDYLHSKGRACTPVETMELIRLQYEVRYACQAAPAASAAAKAKTGKLPAAPAPKS